MGYKHSQLSPGVALVLWVTALTLQVGASECGASETELLQKALQSQKLVGLQDYLKDLAETSPQSGQEVWNDKGD